MADGGQESGDRQGGGEEPTAVPWAEADGVQTSGTGAGVAKPGEAMFSSNPELESFGLYRLAEEVSDLVWAAVQHWDAFAKHAMGSQLVEAADSIGSNISESYGRFHYRDCLAFLFYSRGSLSETDTRWRKAYRRGLLEEREFGVVLDKLLELGPRLNGYIRKIRRECSSDSTFQERRTRRRTTTGGSRGASPDACDG